LQILLIDKRQRILYWNLLQILKNQYCFDLFRDSSDLDSKIFLTILWKK
jgi:hypothetical protein